MLHMWVTLGLNICVLEIHFPAQHYTGLQNLNRVQMASLI